MPWYSTTTNGGMESANESSFSAARGSVLTNASAAYANPTQLNSQGFLYFSGRGGTTYRISRSYFWLDPDVLVTKFHVLDASFYMYTADSGRDVRAVQHKADTCSTSGEEYGSIFNGGSVPNPLWATYSGNVTTTAPMTEFPMGSTAIGHINDAIQASNDFKLAVISKEDANGSAGTAHNYTVHRYVSFSGTSSDPYLDLTTGFGHVIIGVEPGTKPDEGYDTIMGVSHWDDEIDEVIGIDEP